MKNNISAIILAAGKGERMKSNTPKVMHAICGRPILGYVLDLVSQLQIKNNVVVLGYKHQEVRKTVKSGAKVAIQKKLVGTADAVKTGLSKLGSFKGAVIVLYGDIPLLKKETVKKLLEHHTKNNLDATILTAKLDKPAGYGRILRDKYSSISGIVEEKDADEFQKGIKEINTGIICFNKEKLARNIKLIKANNRKHEFYLTDIIDIFHKKGFLIEGVTISDIDEAMGINSRVNLAKANIIMSSRINELLMENGVTIVDPVSTFIDYGTKIGRDTIIYPFTVIQRNVRIGKRCSVGPFIHLRDQSVIEDDVIVGNFLEVVRSRISAKTIAKHFGYLGDSRIGRSVNIGAGTVTANFDGENKFNTVIKDGALIGSDTIIVAPAVVGKNAKTGAGAVITRNSKVKDSSIVVGIPAKPLQK